MNSPSRLQIYGLLIAVAVGLAASRIVSAQRLYEPAVPQRWPAKTPRAVPTFGSNDRSRWATVRALVDDGTYVVGQRDRSMVMYSALAAFAGSDPLEGAVLNQAGYRARISQAGDQLFEKPEQCSDTGIIFEKFAWESIDRVLNPDTLEFYSSKPPFLSTLMAGLYWLLQLLTGWTLAGQYTEVVRTLLLLIHPLPFALYLWALARLVDRYGVSDWGRFFVMISACFATMVTPFLNTFNNHTLGTFSVLFCLYSLIAIWERRSAGRAGGVSPLNPSESKPRYVWHHYILAGLFAGFAVTNELPALSFACAVGALLLWWSPLRTLLLFVPALGLIAGAFLYTNYLAMGQVRPAYSEFGGPPPYKRLPIPPDGEQEPGSRWYQYEGSHWRKPVPGQQPRHGIDWARYYETRSVYAVNLLVGHHGLFSLSPIWLLALIGMLSQSLAVSRSRRLPATENPNPLPWFLAPLALVISTTVIAFYLLMSENYGGFTVGPRWLTWLTPLLLLCMLPVADRLAEQRWGRWLAMGFLALSVLSAQYSSWNPWRHPWLHDLFEWQGWVAY